MNTATGTYFDGQVARGRAVTLEFTESARLQVRGDGVTQEIELSLVRISDRLGDIPRYLYLPGDAVVETGANAVVDAVLGQRRQGRGSRLIHALETRHSIVAAACVLLFAAIAALGFYGPPVLARVAAQRVPADVDAKIGAAALAAIRPYFAASSLKDFERARVTRQLDRLLAGASGPRPRIEFRSMNGGLPNAFALPGNIIVVTDELVRLPAKNDEMAAVLAHELGHLEKRHGLQSLLRNSFAVLIVASVTGDLSALTSFAATIPLTILTAGYSRDLEREADRYAFDLLRARGIDPHAFATVLTKLEAARTGLQRNSTYLSTHPATEDRIELFGRVSATEREHLLAEPWLDRATAAKDQRDYKTAIEDYTQFIDRTPTAMAYAQRARCHFQLGENAPAEADAAAALALDPNLIEAHVVRAEAFALGLKKYDEAIADARAALALDPRNAVALATQGLSETMKGDEAAAATDLERAIELAPLDYRGWAYRGYLRERQENYAGAISDYTKALTFEPKIDWLRHSRATLRVRQKDFTGALEDFGLLDATRQGSVFFFQRGQAEQALGKVDPAIADYSQALDRGLDKATLGLARFNRGVAYAAKRNFTAALADYDAVLAMDAKNGRAYLQRAIARRNADKPGDALGDLEKAAQNGITDDVIVRERARTEWHLGHYDEALRSYDRILKARPDVTVFRDRGLLEYAMGDFEKAEADLDSYLTKARPGTPDYAEFFRLLSRRRRQVNDGRSTFKDTVSAWPDGWAKWVGWYLAGELDEAGLLAETGNGGSPTKNERLCEAYFYIGATHLIDGDAATARKFFLRCVGTGVTDFSEYMFAQSELEHLGQGN